MTYTKTTNASRRAARPVPGSIRAVSTTLLYEKGVGEGISYYAPRWFRRQNKGKTLAAFRTSLRVQLAVNAVARKAAAA